MVSPETSDIQSLHGNSAQKPEVEELDGPVEAGTYQKEEPGPVDAGTEPKDIAEEGKEPTSVQPTDTDAKTAADPAEFVAVSRPAENEVDDELEENEDYQNIAGPEYPVGPGNVDYATLDRKLSERKRARLPKQLEEAEFHVARTKAEYTVDQRRVKKDEAKMADLSNKKAAAIQAKQSAQQDVWNLEKQVDAQHQRLAAMQATVEQAKRAVEEDKGFLNAAAVQEEVTNAEEGAGDTLADDQDGEEHQEERRQFYEAQYQDSVNKTKEAQKMVDDAVTKLHEVEATETGSVQDRWKLNQALSEADRKLAGLDWDIDHYTKEGNRAKEELAEAKAVEQIGHRDAEAAEKHLMAQKKATHRLAEGEEDEVSADALDPSFARQNAVHLAQDHDGIGDDGSDLIARKGAIAREYERVWHTIKMPTPSNPLLDAAANAAIKDPPL
jgi:hypothetical protein